MGRKRTPGLRFRSGVWHIEKRISGVQVFESTGESTLEAAETYLARRIEEIRQARVYGVRPRRQWREAATKYLEEHTHKDSIKDDATHLAQLDPYIGRLTVDQVHDGTLAPFKDARRKAGRRAKSINLALGVVRRILNLAARSWRDEHGLTWLETAPLITMLPVTDAATPYPLDWEEQRRLFQCLPEHLAEMALYKVNTGAREQEVCGLRWEWEIPVPELGRPVFLIPGERVKNGADRIHVLNDVAWSVIERRRSQRPAAHLEECQGRPCTCSLGVVFTFRGYQVGQMHNTAWKRAWRAAELPTGPEHTKGVHNLKHTFGRRLRAAGVPLETRKVLLGHKNGDITTHYSGPELLELLEAAQRVSDAQSGKTPALTLLKRKAAG